MSMQEPTFFPRLRAGMAFEPWCLDVVETVGTDIRVAGWAIPVAGDPARGSITFNGMAARQNHFGIPRPDISNIYAYAPNATLSGFSATGTFDPNAIDIQIEYVDAATSKPVCAYHSFFLPLQPETLLIPDAVHRTRTTGVITETTFKFSGYTLVRKFDSTLKQYAGRGISGFASVLDRGAGCGRLSRYILRELGQDAKLTMADIDADNVAWCASNIPIAKAVVLPLMPPSTLPGDGFDLVIGNSIFTHLQEAVQFAWLEELKRMATRGPISLLPSTTSRDMLRATYSAEIYSKLFLEGFVDEFSDLSLEGNIADGNYYRASFHTHDYVYKNWSKVLRVEAIIPDYSNNHQDLVILRKGLAL